MIILLKVVFFIDMDYDLLMKMGIMVQYSGLHKKNSRKKGLFWPVSAS